MKVAMIGTVGVPAKYGGYETLVDNLIDKKINPEIQYIVYCSSKAYEREKRIDTYKGAKLVYWPMNANGWQSILYDSISLVHAYFVSDVILSLGTVGSFILPILRLFSRKKIIVNLDGLDNRRAKFNHFSQCIIGAARRLAAKYADICISDNQGIKDYVLKTYNRNSELIEYGGDNAFQVEDDEKLRKKYSLERAQYCFKVARIEPENNIEMLLQAFAQLPEETLVLVGNWNRSKFGRRMMAEYTKYKNIKLFNPIYDALEINLLRSNCKFYIHGHSAGGTNPSLVEAMNLHLPIIAYDVVYNKETTEYKALYFEDSKTLIRCIRSSDELKRKRIADAMYAIARRRYLWSIICKKYESLFI